MSRIVKVQHFDSEGRENLPIVIKNIKNYLRGFVATGANYPSKIVFFTGQGEGPMLAYNQLGGLEVKIFAVTFPANYTERSEDGTVFRPEIPDKVQKFFKGVEIPVITGRLPFDDITGCESHNKEMALIRSVLGLYGGSVSLLIQAVLQATDAGHVKIGEQVIAASGDAAFLITASTTKCFLRKDHLGLCINEVICKPGVFSFSRRVPKHLELPKGNQIEATLSEKSEI